MTLQLPALAAETNLACPVVLESNPFYSDDIVFYVHVPFCTSKCHFCYWVTKITSHDLVRRADYYEAYTTALIAEVEGRAAQGMYAGHKLKSIYFGGGTPSVLKGEQLGRVLKAVLQNHEKASDFETITTEISPQTVDLEKLTVLRESGFDRISMGVQLFSDEVLRKQGRNHSVEQAIEAYYLARQAGFENINLDLMVGLPDSTNEHWEDSIRTAIQLYPEHLSLYIYLPASSTVSGKQVSRGLAELQADTEVAEQYLWASRELSDNGYLQYSQHLFERQGKRCNCDESYFQLKEEWVGHGAGGASVFNRHSFGHSLNIDNYIANPLRYDFNSELRRSPHELWMFVLRMLFTKPGICYEAFEKRVGMDFQAVMRITPRLRDFIERIQSKYEMVSDERGLRYADFSVTTRALAEQRWYMGKIM